MVAHNSCLLDDECIFESTISLDLRSPFLTDATSHHRPIAPTAASHCLLADYTSRLTASHKGLASETCIEQVPEHPLTKNYHVRVSYTSPSAFDPALCSSPGFECGPDAQTSGARVFTYSRAKAAATCTTFKDINVVSATPCPLASLPHLSTFSLFPLPPSHPSIPSSSSFAHPPSSAPHPTLLYSRPVPLRSRLASSYPPAASSANGRRVGIDGVDYLRRGGSMEKLRRSGVADGWNHRGEISVE